MQNVLMYCSYRYDYRWIKMYMVEISRKNFAYFLDFTYKVLGSYLYLKSIMTIGVAIFINFMRLPIIIESKHLGPFL